MFVDNLITRLRKKLLKIFNINYLNVNCYEITHFGYIDYSDIDIWSAKTAETHLISNVSVETMLKDVA